MGTIILSLVTFLVGLAKHDKPEGETAEGEFNNLIVRLGAFAMVVLLQVYLLFFFVKEHMQKLKEMKVPTLLKQPSKKLDVKSAQKKKSRYWEYETHDFIIVALKWHQTLSFVDRKNDSESDLTEADQNLKRTIHARKAKAK